MCTVSWRQSKEGYDLFFNRDELRSRAEEQPPTVGARDGVRFIRPLDGQAGGTWLAANDRGLTVCLLNDYTSAWRPCASGPRFSRGHIVAGAADARDLDEVLHRVEAQPLTLLAPFHLLALQPGETSLVLHWNGAVLAEIWRTLSPPLLTSSSFDPATVIAARLATFQRLVRKPDRPTVGELACFHRYHDPAAGAHSVAMSRPDASTRSTIRVHVDSNHITLAYHSLRVATDLRLDRVMAPGRATRR